jgi:hypothetical protein
MVFTDGIHLMANDLDELHSFAKSIGLQRRWFQNRLRHPHYDLISKIIVQRALEKGAIKTTTRDMLEKVKGSL